MIALRGVRNVQEFDLGGDHFHEFRGLFEVRLQWEKKAYSAIAKEDEAVRKFHHAKALIGFQGHRHNYLIETLYECYVARFSWSAWTHCARTARSGR